jgi:hypothetical protein
MYAVKLTDNGQSYKMTGQQLLTAGINVTLPQNAAEIIEILLLS